MGAHGSSDSNGAAFFYLVVMGGGISIAGCMQTLQPEGACRNQSSLILASVSADRDDAGLLYGPDQARAGIPSLRCGG